MASNDSPLPTLLTAGNLRGAAGRAAPDMVPVEYITGWIKKRMPEFGGRPPRGAKDRVLVVKAETGSGKSTALPAHIFRLLRDPRTGAGSAYSGRTVLCTQPRIITAQVLARDLDAAPWAPDLTLGETVGFQTGPLNELPLQGLFFATAATLLQQLRIWSDDEVTARYHTIIIDEAHERSVDLDCILMRLKAFIARGAGSPRLPFVILASATIAVDKYATYFGVGEENTVEVRGRAHPIRDHFPAVGTNDYLGESVRVALEIHRDNSGDTPGRGDILIFIPAGGIELETVARKLEAANAEFLAAGTPPFLVLVLNRAVVTSEGPAVRLLKTPPEKLRMPPPQAGVRPSRRIVVSTVVAETGLTIESLKYVVDCGWYMAQEAYFPQNVGGLVSRPAPQSRIEQRRGRVGRLFAGEFYPLYTRGVHEALDDDQLPEIITQGVGLVFLDIVKSTCESAAERAAGARPGEAPVFRVADIDMLDTPPVDALATALETALTCGFLRAPPAPTAPLCESHPFGNSGEGHVLTPAGEIAVRLGDLGVRESMEAARVLLGGYLWQVSILDLVTVVAQFAVPSIYLPADRRPGGAGAPADFEALLAGVPGHLQGPRRGGGALPPSEREAPYYRARLLIADDFLEGALVFDGFARALDRADGDLARLQGWCADHGIDLSKALDLAGWRDVLINKMIAAGVNPFWGGGHRLAETSPGAFGDTVARLKHCIFEGLRGNVLAYDARADVYRTRRGDAVAVPPRFADPAFAQLEALGVRGADGQRLQKPALLVTNRISLAPVRGVKKAPPLNLYRLKAAGVSVLDGFVAPDPTYDDPAG